MPEPEVEKVFHDDSYGYRPGRSPVDAVRTCRERCWRRDWIVDLEVRAFVDSVPGDLMLKAVARHTDRKWVMMSVIQNPVIRGNPRHSSISDRNPATRRGR